MEDRLLTSQESLAEQYEEHLRRVYQLGLLHGINSQSMAQVEKDVMEFDDFGWDL